MTLLPWSIGAFTVAVAYVWSLPWLAAKGYAQQPNPKDISVSRYIENPHANGAFAVSLIPLITLQWVDLAGMRGRIRDTQAFHIGVAALLASQTGFGVVVGFDANYDPDYHIWAWVLMVTSLVAYYLCVMRAGPPVRVQWPLYILLLTIAGLFTRIVYEMYVSPSEQGKAFYHTEASLLTALTLFTPLRLYLSR